MKTWLCIGDKKKNIPKCPYAKIHNEILKREWGKNREVMIVDCNKTLRVVTRYITECKYYYNQTLEECLKK